jgi:DNA-directed RNA polymerase specialized sigma24 family protein
VDADDDPEDVVRQAYQVHYGRLVAQLFGLIGDLAEAEDAVQDAFARVLARPKAFLAAEDPERWLRVVALNVARTRYRRRWVFDRLVRAGRVDVTPAAVPGLSVDRWNCSPRCAGWRRRPARPWCCTTSPTCR